MVLLLWLNQYCRHRNLHLCRLMVLQRNDPGCQEKHQRIKVFKKNVPVTSVILRSSFSWSTLWRLLTGKKLQIRIQTIYRICIWYNHGEGKLQAMRGRVDSSSECVTYQNFQSTPPIVLSRQIMMTPPLQKE